MEWLIVCLLIMHSRCKDCHCILWWFFHVFCVLYIKDLIMKSKIRIFRIMYKVKLHSSIVILVALLCIVYKRWMHIIIVEFLTDNTQQTDYHWIHIKCLSFHTVYSKITMDRILTVPVFIHNAQQTDNHWMHKMPVLSHSTL